MKKTTFYINNKTVHMEGDWTILQACEKIGLFIPRFCYSESLSIAGNCRMCLVEIENSPKLMPSCAIKTTPDMKIHTKTNLVKKTRESILEFLLINHPLDCPICDQGGECDLQDQAMIYGSDRGRFYEYKRSLEDKNAGPLIKTIMTRCIHCTRCIRFATEVAGIESFGTTGRGKHMEVGTYISNIFNSELSGNVIDLCPVGALTSKPYAFTVRPWELKSIETIDVLDSIGSNIIVNTRGSELMRILPKSNDNLNQQWITDKTRFSYDGLKCQRLKYPMLKTDSGFIKISWKDAFLKIKEKINNISRTDIEFQKKFKGVIGPFVDQQSIYNFKKFLNTLGVSQLYINNMKNKWNENQYDNIDFRWNYLFNTSLSSLKSHQVSDDLDDIDSVLLIGSNPRFEGPLFNVRLRQMVIRKNLHVNYIGSPMDLRYNATHLGTGIKILLDIAQGKNNYVSHLLLSKNPLFVLGSTLLNRKDTTSLRILLHNILKMRSHIYKELSNSKHKNTNRLKYTIFNKHFQSLRTTNLNTVNSLKEPWKHISVLHTYASTPGALDLGYYPNPKINWISKNNDEQIIYLLGADFDIKTNKNSFIIYQGHHGDIGAKNANIILPSTSYIEKNAYYMNTEGRIQQSKKAIQPDSEIRDDSKIIQALCNFLEIQQNEQICSDIFILKEFNKNIKIEEKNNNKNLSLWLNKASVKKFEKVHVNKDFMYLNKYVNNYYKLFVTQNFNKNKLETKDILLKSLNNITPFTLNCINTSKISPLFSQVSTNAIKINNTKFIPHNLVDNFYLGDVITRSSKTMGKCSVQFQKHNFIY